MSKRNTILLLGLIGFSLLVIFSIIFYKERILFADPAFQLSYMIRDNIFAIQVNRFVAVLSKIFPYLAMKLSLPLNYVVLIYSVSFPIYNLIFFLIILVYFKSREWALALLLYNILIISHSFYWPAIELNQGIAVMILYFAFLSYQKDFLEIKLSHWLFSSLMVVTIIFAHPLAIIPFLFFHIYLYLSNKSILKNKLFNAGIIISILSLIVKRIFFRNWYDDLQMASLNNFKELFPNYLDIQSNKNFLQYILSDYYISGVLAIIITIFMIKKHAYFKLFIVWGFILGYLFLVNISFPEGSNRFFAESKYMLLSLFIIAPIIFDIFPKIKTNHLLFATIIILSFRMVHIYNTHSLYTNRLDWLRNTIIKTDNLEHKKLIINQADVPIDTLMLTWASSYEFLLLSTIENNESRSIIITENPTRFDSLLNNKNIFFEEWRKYKYQQFPKKYFNLKDTAKYSFYK